MPRGEPAAWARLSHYSYPQRKVQGRWPKNGDALPLPIGDEHFPECERLPRQTSVRFVESIEDGNTIVRLFGPDGAQLGNQLTDNAYEDDGYRFHDVFHLSYAALLGWSPITRFFFDAKRESDAKVREVEDAGSATVIEEAISAFVFDYGRNERFLEGVEARRLLIANHDPSTRFAAGGS